MWGDFIVIFNRGDQRTRSQSNAKLFIVLCHWIQANFYSCDRWRVTTDMLESDRLYNVNCIQVPWKCKVSLLSPVHTSNNVEATGNNVEATFEFVEAKFDFVAKKGNNVERVYHKILFFRQSLMWLRHCCCFWQQCLTSFFVKFCSFETNWTCSVCFDFVAKNKNGNNVEATFNFVEATFHFVERIVRLIAFDNVASMLLLVWTGL